jgi:hypothetical protein
MAVQDFSGGVAEVSYYFQNRSANPLVFVGRAVGENLLRKRAHATARLSRADCADDCGV